jgi:hypothetical protein
MSRFFSISSSYRDCKFIQNGSEVPGKRALEADPPLLVDPCRCAPKWRSSATATKYRSIGDNLVITIAWCVGVAVLSYAWSRRLYEREPKPR